MLVSNKHLIKFLKNKFYFISYDIIKSAPHFYGDKNCIVENYLNFIIISNILIIFIKYKFTIKENI